VPATALGFVAEGANFVIADVLEQEGRGTLAADSALTRNLSLARRQRVKRHVAATVAAGLRSMGLGPVSVLSTTGASVRFATDRGDRACSWRRVIDINLTRYISGDRAIVHSMRKGRRRRDRQYSSAAVFLLSLPTRCVRSHPVGCRGD